MSIYPEWYDPEASMVFLTSQLSLFNRLQVHYGSATSSAKTWFSGTPLIQLTLFFLAEPVLDIVVPNVHQSNLSFGKGSKYWFGDMIARKPLWNCDEIICYLPDFENLRRSEHHGVSKYAYTRSVLNRLGTMVVTPP